MLAKKAELSVGRHGSGSQGEQSNGCRTVDVAAKQVGRPAYEKGYWREFEEQPYWLKSLLPIWQRPQHRSSIGYSPWSVVQFIEVGVYQMVKETARILVPGRVSGC
jgi:hypothetical protein